MSGSVDSFPMSPQQARVWAIEPDVPAARVQGVLSIDGPLEPMALADALRACVARHEILRTTFAAQAGFRVPLQVLSERLDPHVETTAVDALSERERRLAEVRAAELAVPFDVNQGPLVRASILTTGADAFALVLTVSALCADSESVALVLGEVASVLASAELVQDPLQYADFAAWQQELSESEDDEAAAARAFWSDAAGASAPTLPFARGEGSEPLEEVTVTIDEALARGLREQTTRYGAGPAAAVQAAWHAVLGRFSGEDETHSAYLPGERRHSDLDGAVGAFARPVPVGVRVEGSRTFAEALADVVQEREQALLRQDYAPEGGRLDIGFAEYPLAIAQPEGLRLRVASIVCSGPELRLLAMCGTDGERLAVSLAFDPARHRRETVEGLADGLLNVLAAATADPSATLGSIELLSERARTRVLHDLNDTGAPVPTECVHELFAQHARSAPERTAVSDGERSLTYGELDASANRLAHRLRTAGVGPDVAVGLCTDRSTDMIVGLLGILKAGGTYVPLHHEHPPARLCHQLAAAGAIAVVTQEALLERLQGFEGEAVCLDRDRDAIERESAEPLEGEARHEHRAYVIFTSGSTGAPKGVDVTHGNLANYAADIVRRLGADEQPLTFGLVTSVSTDLGNTSVFGALCSGGTLVLVSPTAAGDPGALAALMDAESVDVLKITPSHLGALLAAGDARVLPRRRLVLGGERADWDLIARVRGLAECSILNHYGPTETTVGSCTFVVGDGPGEYAPASVPIGRPISNTRCYVVDDGGAPTPIGVSGRLLIGGAGVARGYVGEPELTAERFFADPFEDDGDARVYDTGDLARWLPDGTLEFMGRVDEQVKIRGYRVEPAEVDSALRRHSGVREAITVTHAVDDGETRLIAYCTTEEGVDDGSLRGHLAEWLPEYMLPGAIVVVEELPRTPSGKIDRLALPDPALASADGADYVAPRSPLEEAVAAIWAQVLRVPRVGVEDDFFALGGHSLLATQVVAQVRSDFAVDLPLHSLFTYPTVTTLSAEIVGMMGDSEGDETARLMAELEGMSDEEAQRLLAEDLQPEAGQG